MANCGILYRRTFLQHLELLHGNLA